MNPQRIQVVIEAQNKVDAAMKDAEKSIGTFQSRVESMTPTFKKMAVAGVAATAAIGAGLLQSVRSFERFDEEIKRAGAFVNATAEELDAFRESAINAARGTQFSFEETAIALQNFAGGEISAAEASEELGNIIDLALVSKIDDLQQAVNLGSLALTVFQDDGMEMSDVIDTMATVAADITTQTDAWSTALVNSAGNARAAGLSFKDLNVIFANMVRGGADVNLIWSAFNSAIISIQAPSEKTAGELEAVGLSVSGLQEALASGPIELLEYLKKGFDKAQESGRGVAFLAQVLGRQAAPEFAIAFAQTNETMEETASWFDDIEGRGAEMTKTLREAQPATAVLGQALSELNLTVGQALAPALAALLEIVTPIIQAVANWAKEHPKLTAAIALGVIGLTALVAIIGTLGLVVAAVTAVMSPWLLIIGAVILAVGALAAAGIYLYTQWDTVRAKILEIWENIKTGFESAKEAIINNTIKPLMEWIDKIRSALQAVADAASAIGGAVGKVVGKAVKAVTGRASGGPVTSGVPYVVGEQGPELFVPSRSGTIVPNGGFGGVSITITGNTFMGREGVAKQIADEIMRQVNLRMKVA
jgi:TP901 family phage tail tape measure protein